MNRRSFLSKIIAAAVAPAILPSALTYARTWRKTAAGLVVPTYTLCQDEDFKCILEGPPKIYQLQTHTWNVELNLHELPPEYVTRLFNAPHEPGKPINLI